VWWCRTPGNSADMEAVSGVLHYNATGLGPLASNSVEGGHRLGKKDLKRMMPPARKPV
jgi:hypothetical protein